MKIIEKRQLIFHICQKKLLEPILPNTKAEFNGTKTFARSFPLSHLLCLEYIITLWTGIQQPRYVKLFAQSPSR